MQLADSDAGRKALQDAIKANAAKTHAGEHAANADDFDKDLADAQARLEAANAAARAARDRSRRPASCLSPAAWVTSTAPSRRTRQAPSPGLLRRASAAGRRIPPRPSTTQPWRQRG